MSELIKANTRIEIYRSSEDNGNNGSYYKSLAIVTVCGVKMNEVQVQSTADHDKLNNGEKKYEGGTIEAGTYTLTLLNKSGSYNRAISITGNNVSESDAVLIHPDVFTAKGKSESYSKYGKPYSLACQIMKLENFDEVVSILSELGFSPGMSTNSNLSWLKGDKLTLIIYEPIPEEN